MCNLPPQRDKTTIAEKSALVMPNKSNQASTVSYKHCSVSIVIPSHNRVDHLAQCLRAVRNGTYKPLEILVVDKSFNLETKKVCDSFWATYIVCGGSITQALNKGIEYARGDILAFTDDDAIPDNRWVESITKSFAKNAKVGAVGGPAPVLPSEAADASRITLFKIPLISTIYDVVVLDGRQGKAIGHLARSGETVNSEKITSSPVYVDYVQGCNIAVRRDLAIETGGFCTLLLGHSEYWEVDFCTRIRNQGFGILFDPQVRVTHKVAGGARRPFFDRCYNYVTFFLMNRKKANLRTMPFLINLATKNAFYLIFPFLERNTHGYVYNLRTLKPLAAIVLAFNKYLKSRGQMLSHART